MASGMVHIRVDLSHALSRRFHIEKLPGLVAFSA
jgi:hypothetical protein